VKPRMANQVLLSSSSGVQTQRHAGHRSDPYAVAIIAVGASRLCFAETILRYSGVSRSIPEGLKLKSSSRVFF